MAIETTADTDRDAVRAIVRRWGWNGTAYQILNPGFTYWIDPANDAAVGYVERNRIRVVGGAPVCADARLRTVMELFERDASEAGHGVAYFCAEARLAALAASDTGRTTFAIGSQPSWRPADLLREFGTHASLRAQLNRARNKNVVVERAMMVGVEMGLALQSCLNEWKMDRGLPALHFLVETDTLHELDDRILHVATLGDTVVGFVVATPIPARNGWLIEQIVRARHAPNGTAELLLYHAACTLEEEGASMMTLGLAPLARRTHPIVDQAPRWLAALFAALRAHGRNFYNFEGLEAFKAKFSPEQWESVYVSLAPGTGMPQALIAITGAFTGKSLIRFVPQTLTHGMLREIRRLVK